MKRSEKESAVEQLGETFAKYPHAILATYSGLTVNQANALRSKVRGAGGSYRVIKNRLAKRAAAGTPMEPLSERLTGPCAIAVHETDPVVLAKAIAEFAKDNPQIEPVAAIIDAKAVVDAAGVKQLALLPGLPELRAQLLCLIQTPATTLVRLLGTPGTQLARVLDAREGEAEG